MNSASPHAELHNGLLKVQLSAFSLLLPSLIISYLGEGAYLVKHPEDYPETFWKSLPHGTFWPMCAFILWSGLRSKLCYASFFWKLHERRIP